MYGITINEILSAQRLEEGAYRQQAEENIKSVIDNSSFILKKKINFYKKKWRREHRRSLIAVVVVFALLHIVGWGNDTLVVQLIATLMMFAMMIIRNNSMMIYVEKYAFGPVVNGSEPTDMVPMGWTMKRIRMMTLLLQILMIWICVDLGCNYLAALVPEMNEGITVWGIWSVLFFGADGDNWNLKNFYNGFAASLQAAGGVGALNIILAYLNFNRVKGQV